MSLIIPANSAAASGGFNVANSVNCGDTSTRFSGSSKVTSTSQQKGSWNIWLKKTVLGAQGLFKVYESANTGVEFGFDSGDQLFMKEFESGSDVFNLKPSAVFRDTSAWMNILLAIDTTQGTEANRIRLYINGVEPSLATSTRPSVNTNLVRFFANSSGSSAQIHEMGNGYEGGDTGHYLLTQILYVDGTQLANTDVGEFDEDSGIWKPIDISETTLGNNGYYLSMEDSSNFGTATGKSFTAHGFAATDSRTDTCTNNFATLNPLNSSSNDSHTPPTYSEGNLQSASPSSGGGYVGSSTIGVTNGKWFWEFKKSGGSATNIYNGIGNELGTAELARQSAVGVYFGNQVFYRPDGTKQIVTNGSNANSSYGASWTTNDIIGIALDLDSSTNTVTFYKNGASQGAINLPVNTDTWFFIVACGTDTVDTWQLNFGSPPYAISSGNTDGNGYGNFEYAVPSGYYSLCTKNLAEYG